ncbi:MAG TPA: terminase, partial [Roseiflexaceae bacterium]
MTVIEFPSAPRLSETIGRYRFDPLGFVMFAFPWGRPGTSLANESGPEPWQCEVLEKLGRGLKQRDTTSDEAVRLAVASGHGIGKSALVAWIILWALSTLSDTRGIVTANTEGQLR